MVGSRAARRGRMTYLLDTNTCLDVLLGRSERVMATMERRAAVIAISAITVAELRVGNRYSAEPEEDARRVDLFLSAVPSFAFDETAAEAYGRVIRRVGVKRLSFDRLIAAHAVALGRVMVAGNGGDFADVPGLVVENWR